MAASKKNILIVGGGGHSRVLMDAIASTGRFDIKGILDPILKPGTIIDGVKVLGGDDLLSSKYKPSGYVIAIGVGSIRASRTRQELFEKISKMGFEFPAIIHKTAYVSKRSKVSDGAQVFARAVIQPGAVIGENTIINTGAIIEHDAIIGAHSHISPGAVLGGGVRVGSGSHIGLGARVIQGITIGAGATVGAGAVVVSDIADGQIVKGVPAR